jgi:hypothetical protein
MTAVIVEMNVFIVMRSLVLSYLIVDQIIKGLVAYHCVLIPVTTPPDGDF